MRLIGFKHLDPAYIEANFCALAVCEGSIGLVYDVKRSAMLNAIHPEATSSLNNTDIIDEIAEVFPNLCMMFTNGLRTFYWCWQCKQVSNAKPCGCPECKGIVDVDWDGLSDSPNYISPVYRYTIRMQSLPPIVVIGYKGALTTDEIITNIKKRYHTCFDSRYKHLFIALSTFGVPDRGQTIKFAYPRRTVGNITCTK